MMPKYKVGQKVYICFKNDRYEAWETNVDVIDEIVIRERGVFYYTSEYGEELDENEIFSTVEEMTDYLTKVLEND